MFQKAESTKLKGIAIILMLWHHCFLTGRFEKFDISFYPFTQNFVTGVASYAKICVSLFAFVSGYGLYLAYTNKKVNNTEWVLRRYKKTMAGYWFVVIISWIVCFVIDKRPISAYGLDESVTYGAWSAFVDFCGLSNFFGKSPLNGTWWYMSAIIVFIALTPIIVRMFEKIGVLATITATFILPRMCTGFPGATHFLSFLTIFTVGAAFAKKSLFKEWEEIKALYFNGQIKRCCLFAAEIALIVFSKRLYLRMPNDLWWDIKWGIMPLFVIVFLNDFIFPLKVFSKILYFIGTHSMNIFLVHPFIIYYLENFTYSFHNFALIIVVVLLLSLMVSIILEALKKMLKYNKILNLTS